MLIDRLAKQFIYRRQSRVKTKHWQAVLRYSTPKKVTNAVKLLAHMVRRDAEVRAYPFQLTLDTTSVCNLKCPLCPTGMGILDRNQSMMDFDLYRKIIDTLSSYLYIVNLFNFGEPLFNKRLPEYIAYARLKRIYTSISTNLTFLSEKQAEALVRSGLDHLLLSIDGLSQETYSQYRIGGELDAVLSNLDRLLAVRKRLGSTLPMVEWQYLVFRHNRHEVPYVEAFARSKGVDAVYIRKGSGPQEWSASSDGQPRLALYQSATPDKPCDFLYYNLVTHADGGVSPCCYLHRREDDFGDFMDTETFMSLWNNEKYQQARRQFAQKQIESDSSIACNECWVLTSYLEARSPRPIPATKVVQ